MSLLITRKAHLKLFMALNKTQDLLGELPVFTLVTLCRTKSETV